MSYRHSFKIDLTHGDVEPRDEVLDRRRRGREDLLMGDSPIKSRIYGSRHRWCPVEPQSDGLYLNFSDSQDNVTMLPAETANQMPPPALPLDTVQTQLSGSSWRGYETELRKLAAMDKNREENFLEASEAKLNKKMLEFERSSNMTDVEQAAWERVVQEIVTDMKDPSVALGKLVNKIKGTHRSLDGGGSIELATEFTEFGNNLARRMQQTSIRRDDTQEPEVDVFQAVGSCFERGDDMPQGPLHTLVHVNHIESYSGTKSKDVIAFGQVEKEAAWDLTDELVGSMFRYMLAILEYRTVSGKSSCFTLCGPLLRVFRIDPAGFSTSAAYSFQEEADYESIVNVMAFLCGPFSRVLERWLPSAEEALSVQKLDGNIVRYRLSNIRALSISPVIWGSRTATWSAQAERLDEHGPGPSYEKLPLIIKSSWLPNQFYAHELEILEKIAEAKSKCLASESFVPLLPYPVGHVINSIQHTDIDLADWKVGGHGRTGASLQNSTMVTFCEPGVHVDEDLPTLKNHVRLHRSLTQTLGWLAEHGIHYRDLNNGNVLRSSTGECILIDFGNARYLRRPRGQTNPDGSAAVHISFDDARSGTLMFMSRRIHALTEMDIAHKSNQAEYENNLRKLQAETDVEYKSDMEQFCAEERENLTLRQEQMTKVHNEHCYAHDGESQFYLMMQQILFPSHATHRFTDMENLGVKREYWDHARVKLHDADLLNPDWRRLEAVAKKFRKEVDDCLKEIEKGVADGSLGDREGWPYNCEKRCFERLVEIQQAEEARQERALQLATKAMGT